MLLREIRKARLSEPIHARICMKIMQGQSMPADPAATRAGCIASLSARKTATSTVCAFAAPLDTPMLSRPRQAAAGGLCLHSCLR
eukprot:1880598-Rhodomonas_salina.1